MAEQEGPQDQVAQAWFLRHDPAQLRDRDCQNLSRGGGDRAQEGSLPGEYAYLAQELRRAVAGDGPRPRLAVALDDVSGTREQHDQVVGHVTSGEQHIASGYVAFAAVRAQDLELGRIQDRRTPGYRDQPILIAARRRRRNPAFRAGHARTQQNSSLNDRRRSSPPGGQDTALLAPVTLRRSVSTSVSSCSATRDAAASR